MDHAWGVAPPGYRLPDATRLGRVRLQVADLARSLAYYERVLGLRAVSRTGGRAELGTADGTVIAELRELPGAAPVPHNGRLGLYHFAILLPDRSALGSFVAHLATIGRRAGMSDHLVSEAVYLTDPDGLGIEVYADRARGEWRQDGRQLRMATEPLDVAAVVAAAGGREWEGMPDGTRLGHVHLFVANLDESEKFYHAGLGFDKVVWSYPGALFLSAGGYHHHLGTNTWARHAAPAAGHDARLLDWEVVLPAATDVSAAAASLASQGAAVEWDAAGAAVRDPWGTQLRLIAAA
ncbi:MAG TPA: VOC family protein [Gemmatimonadaceae bacterium]|nr:VOC family protein [Gemmatimonadaceae bacterium]